MMIQNDKVNFIRYLLWQLNFFRSKPSENHNTCRIRSIEIHKFVTRYFLGGKNLSFRKKKIWPFFWCVFFSVLIRTENFFWKLMGWGLPPPGGHQDGYLFTWDFGQMISSSLLATFSVLTLGISNWVKLNTPPRSRASFLGSSLMYRFLEFHESTSSQPFQPLTGVNPLSLVWMGWSALRQEVFFCAKTTVTGQASPRFKG